MECSGQITLIAKNAGNLLVPAIQPIDIILTGQLINKKNTHTKYKRLFVFMVKRQTAIYLNAKFYQKERFYKQQTENALLNRTALLTIYYRIYWNFHL